MRAPLSLFVALSIGGLTWPAAASAASGTVTTATPVKQPPFYLGKPVSTPTTPALLPVRIAPAPGELPDDWVPLTAMNRLAEDIERWLGETGLVRVLPDPAGSAKAFPPAVYLGCEPDEMIPGECSEEPRQNVLISTSANREWRNALGGAVGGAGVDRVLVLRLDVAPHWIHQKNLKGTKEVRLGTGYAQRLPWLTSLDTPVYVLQLTGAVVDAEGKVLRSGAEGLLAVRTPFKASVLRAQKLISEEDVELLRTGMRRDDLPDAPAVWQAAARNLVTQLAGTPASVAAVAGTAP